MNLNFLSEKKKVKFGKCARVKINKKIKKTVWWWGLHFMPITSQMTVPSSILLYPICSKKQTRVRFMIPQLHILNEEIMCAFILPCDCYKYHGSWMSCLTFGQMKKKRVWRQSQDFSLQMLHRHMCWEESVIQYHEPLIPEHDTSRTGQFGHG